MTATWGLGGASAVAETPDQHYSKEFRTLGYAAVHEDPDRRKFSGKSRSRGGTAVKVLLVATVAVGGAAALTAAVLGLVEKSESAGAPGPQLQAAWQDAEASQRLLDQSIDRVAHARTPAEVKFAARELDQSLARHATKVDALQRRAAGLSLPPVASPHHPAAGDVGRFTADSLRYLSDSRELLNQIRSCDPTTPSACPTRRQVAVQHRALNADARRLAAVRTAIAPSL